MQDTIILLVDDEPAILSSMNEVLSSCYKVRAANTGSHALKIADTEPRPDLILLDVQMSELNGYSVLSKLKENASTSDIPVIFVTAMEAAEDEEKGLELGAVDYIVKPINPAILLARVKTHLLLKQARDFLNDKNAFLEAEVSRRMEENQTIQNVSICALASLAETRDSETGDHILRTQAYIEILARHLQNHPRFCNTITPRFIQLLTKSAPLHDIGKVGIPDRILLKPGKLTGEEWKFMKTHAKIGAHAIERAEKGVNQPVEFLTIAKEIANWHHERWDGRGYPDGLVGNAIPISARLMALADVFDALISRRVYKPPMPIDKACEIITNQRNHQFDPDVVDAFLANFDEFAQIACKYKDVA